MKKHVSILLGLMVIFSSLFTSCNNEDELDPNICKITVNSEGNGTVSITDYIGTSVNVLIGNQVEVVATPDDGWAFTGWYVDKSETPVSTDTIFIFTVSENITLTARFTQHSEIIIRSEGNGNVSFVETTGDSITVLYGTEVTVAATPDDNAEFLGWFIGESETAVCLEENYSFIAKENITLIGKFSKLNSECNIIAVKASWLEKNNDILTRKPTISQNEVKFYVNEKISLESLKQLDPEFELSLGAHIKKLDHIVENGDRGIYLYYRTVSEDEKWSKDYKVSFTKQTIIDTETSFSFEHFAVEKNYHIWYEEDAYGTRLNWWATANAGFLMSGQGKVPADFPTSTSSDGVIGNCVKLKTCDTGTFGKMIMMPIAAGNIFIGEYQSANAIKAPLEATRFGIPIAPNRPVTLTGYYKYTPGTVFTDKRKTEIIGRRDTCAIYSVVYEIDPDDFEPLDGSNILLSDRIVLIAELENPGEPTEWTPFNIEYRVVGNKVFDRNRLDKGEYAITVIASSSKDGAHFEGAVGSTLCIDELKINWEK